MLYAKSKPEESIKGHTDALLKNEKILEALYAKDIVQDGLQQDSTSFFKLLRLACQYHDIGKVYLPFQNEIRKKLGIPQLETKFSYKNVKHEQLSPLFIPFDNVTLSKEERKILIQTIYYHHERKQDEVPYELVEQIIQQDILPRYEEIQKEVELELNKSPNPLYLGKVGQTRRITSMDTSYIKYCKCMGLLQRLDHCSSARVKVEDDTKEEMETYVEQYLSSKGDLRELQVFCKKNQDSNLIVIGSTGVGKTEAGLLWSRHSKLFFTLPIRISINAIFDRIEQEIGYKHVGLLHSTALDYLEEREIEEIDCAYERYNQAVNLACKVTVCTIDQIFTMVFKYKGYEKIYATLAYSKVIIDEIQAYSPEIVAVILKGIQMLHAIGGKFMIMTATLPRIYREKLDEYGISYQYKESIKHQERHKIFLKEKEMKEDATEMINKGKDNKVLVIVNTVNKAIELYQTLRENAEEVTIRVLHSRFIQEDRSRLEKEIKEFSKGSKKGIWITTQIVEASLDIDFDYLYTEMSTLDSLFQRLGRCYRSREYKKVEPNVFIYTKEVSGIKCIYDEDIYKKSIQLLMPYHNTILQEQQKIDFVDVLYSQEMLKGTHFLKKFEEGSKFLDNLIDYGVNRKEAQRMLRKIENVKVIPKEIYDKNMELFEQYHEASTYNEKKDIRKQIEKLVVQITQNQRNYQVKDKISSIAYVEDIFCVNLKYDEVVGLVLKEDGEYDIASRTY